MIFKKDPFKEAEKAEKGQNPGFWERHGGKVVCLAIGAVIAALAAAFESEQYVLNTHNVMRIVSDGCFTAAVMLIGVGFLVLIDGFGGFDHIFYLFRFLLDKMLPSKTRFEGRITYPEYVAMRRKKHEEKKTGTKTILLTGALFVVLSVVFLVLFEAGK